MRLLTNQDQTTTPDAAEVNAVEALLADAEHDLTHIEHQLRHAAETVAARVNRTFAALDEGRPLNGLGELQSTALDVDRLCAVREAKIAQIHVLESAAASLADDR